MRVRHAAHGVGDHLLTGADKGVERDGNLGHAGQPAPEFFRHVAARRRQQLGQGPVVADQVDDEGGAQPLVDAFARQQLAHIEQVARMLPVERRDQLAGEQIGERHHPHRGEAELPFDDRRHRALLGLVHAPPARPA